MTKPRQDLVTNTKKPSDSAKPAGASQPFKGEDTKNIAQGTTVDSKDGLLSSFQAVPNPMGELFQPTYHFSFYLDTDITANQQQNREYVLAQTGLTGMNIQNVEIETFVGPNIRTRNATATSITIKIYEPMGAMFPDLLFQAAATMNIRNYLKAPWFLKLKLHGYDENGKTIPVGSGWLWKLTLIEVQSQISENGTIHTITAMPLSEVALNNQYCMMPNLVSTSGSTVGEVLQNVIKSMNSSMEAMYGASSPPFIEYAVEERPYPYDTKVGITTPFQHQITGAAAQDTNQSTVINFGTQTSHFASGTDFPAVVDMVMSRSDTAVRMARVSRENPVPGQPDEEKNVADPSSIMHRIDTKVEYRGYDAVIGDYSKKITYIVKPYVSLRLLTSMGRAQSFDKEPKLNRIKANMAMQRSYLKKQYDYIFTGMNTEVEKFDINVNFRWAVSVPMLEGKNFTGTTARVDNVADTRDALGQTQATKTALDNADLALLNFETELKENAKKGITTEETATEARRKELTDARDKAAADNKAISAIAGAGRMQLNQVADAAANVRKVPQQRTIDGEDTVYENTRVDDKGKKPFGGAGAGAGNSSYLPITIVQDPDSGTGSTATGTSTDNSPNKSVYGTLLNQLYGAFDGNLQNLELDIRGDPYWLGNANPGDYFDKDSDDTTPNFMNGEHMFIFRFKLPQGIDAATGTVSVAQNGSGSSNIFTGFYATTSVVNHFRDGYFSQTLSAVRIQGWAYENIIEGRNTDLPDATTYNAPSVPSTTGSSSNSGSSSSGGKRTTTLGTQELLALTLVGEAGGEGIKGQQAVGNVIINRAQRGIRGSTVAEVIMARSQFSVWNGVDPAGKLAAVNNAPEGSAKRNQYNQAYDLAGKLLNKQVGDITGGATDYYAYKQVNPPWASVYKQTVVIGNHRFMKR